MSAVFITLFLLITLTIIALCMQLRELKMYEKFDTPYQLTLKFADIIRIDTSAPYTDYFVRDQLEKFADVSISTLNNASIMVCKNSNCLFSQTFEVQPDKMYVFPNSYMKGLVADDVYFKIKEPYVNNDPYVIVLPITIWVTVELQTNRTYSLKQLLEKTFQQGNIKMTMKSTEEHRSGFSLFLCDDKDVCSLETWHMSDEDAHALRDKTKLRIVKK